MSKLVSYTIYNDEYSEHKTYSFNNSYQKLEVDKANKNPLAFNICESVKIRVLIMCVMYLVSRFVITVKQTVILLSMLLMERKIGGKVLHYHVE